MGKAYAKELAALATTFDWASRVGIEPLEEFVAETVARPLIAVASGGSTTAAHFASLLHREHMRAFARHSTPLEVLLNEPDLHQAAVVLLSASGKNKDVLAALDRSINADVRAVAAVCMKTDSPLASATRAFERGFVCELDAPFGKDGFLATNSLLATCVVIARAYGVPLPRQLDVEVGPKLSSKHTRRFVQVLYGGWGAPIATDLESRLNESAIAAGQVSDYRNFGHGRHLWLAQRASETIVVALITPEIATLAERTCALLPREIPIVELRTEKHGAVAVLDLLVQSLRFVGALGELQSIDPGRPSVPDFGRKLYHLTPSLPAESVEAPVRRKLARTLRVGPDSEARVTSAFEAFLTRLRAMKVGGLVLDYDGTLCTRAERFGILRPELAKECVRLLDSGIALGIATGRGRSVRESLQQALPERLWNEVVIGYYNGCEIAVLADNRVPDRTAVPVAPLDTAHELLRRDAVLEALADLTPRRTQITVEPKGRVSTDALVAHVMTTLATVEPLGVRVVASSHSVDVLGPGVSKLAVVEHLKRRIQGDAELLCIGDRGMWPGNDFSLLSHEPSLSVDEVSGALSTCWNLSPNGSSCTDAVLRYLRAISARRGVGAVALDGLWRSG